MHTLERIILLPLCALALGGWPAVTTADEKPESREAARNSELVIEEDFSKGLENWVWVGPPGAIVEVEDGVVLLDPLEAEHRPPGTEGINLWHRQPLEGDWAIEFDLEPLAPIPGDGKKGNLLFMFNYRHEDPELDVIEEAPRQTGHYPLLHGGGKAIPTIEQESGIKYWPMRGYTITYYRINPEGDPPYAMIVRRNPGFHRVDQEIQTAEDQWPFRHTVRIERRGRSLRLFQNDKLSLETSDSSEEPPSDGYWGIRTWMAKVKIHAARAYQLEPVSATEANQSAPRPIPQRPAPPQRAPAIDRTPRGG